jgi:hypothetical protein
MSTTDDTSATRRGSGSNDLLGLAVNRALFADECQRLSGWALIGPVQRAALESFAERLLAAERERLCEALKIEMQHSAWDGVLQLDDALLNIADALAQGSNTPAETRKTAQKGTP